MPHPYSGGAASGAGALPGLPDAPNIFFPSIPERPVSFSPPPTGPPKGYNNQRRKSTSILEAHTRHFQPAYPRYGSSLHPFSGMEGVETAPVFMVNPSFAAAAQRLGVSEALHLPGQSDQSLYGMRDMRAEHEEAVRRLSLNQAALLDHYEAMAYGGYPMTAHQLSHLTFHQQRQAAAAAASLGYDPVPPPQPGFLHAHLMQRMSAHSPIPPQLQSMGASAGGTVSSTEGCYPPAHVSSSSFPVSAPTALTEPPPSSGSVFDFHIAAAAAAAAGDPGLLASRLYRGRRSSMDLPLEDSAGSGGSGSYSRLQPVTEELYTYISPELPLPPGSLLLHHTGVTVKDRSPEPSSDSLTSSDAGEFQSPPPQLLPTFDPSSAQSIPHSSSASYDTPAPHMSIDPQGHPPSMQTFLPPTPSTELPSRGASSTQLESLMQNAWTRHGGVVPAQPDMTYHESLLAMQATNSTMQVQPPSAQPTAGLQIGLAANQAPPHGTSQQIISSGQSSSALVQSPAHTPQTQVSGQPPELSQSQLLPPHIQSALESGHSEASGLSDGNEGGGHHEGRPTKRHQRRSVRSRSRHEKISKAKLNVLSISNRGDRVAECQLETHNRKMVTFRFDLDGDNPEEIAQIMVESEFILESERESFIEQIREVIENADEKRDANSQAAGDTEQQIPAISEPMPDTPPNATTQVVHSAGRKFIVSPVPEARLREPLSAPTSPAPATPAEIIPPVSLAAPPQTSSQAVGLSQSAGAVSLQQAFSELRQNQTQLDPGPSTAPACIQTPLPPLHPTPIPVPVSSSLSPTAGLLPSLKKQEQSLDLSVPASSPCATSSVPPVCLSPPCTSSPPPSALVLPPLQSQGVSQPDLRLHVTVQGTTQIIAQLPTQPQTTAVGATTTVLPASISSIPQTPLTSPPIVQTVPFVSSPPPSLTSPPSDIVLDKSSGSATSVAPLQSATVVPTTAIPGPLLAASAPTQPAPIAPSSTGLQPVTTSVPSVQPTLVHSQPQTAALPGQTHTHCGECDARCEVSSEAQAKPDDIQALEKKLRSLFMDLGGVASGQGDVGPDSVFSPSMAGTSSPLGPCSMSTIPITTMGSTQIVSPPQPPTSLPLGSMGSSTQSQGPGTPISTPAQTVNIAVPFGQTTPSKTPVSRVPSQQPLEDLDAQLRRALSPETVPLSTHAQNPSISAVGQPIPFSLEEDFRACPSPLSPPAGEVRLGRFKVSLASEEPSVPPPACSESSSTTSSSSTSSSSSNLSSPENTLHKATMSPLKSPQTQDVVDGLPRKALGGSHQPSPLNSPCPSPIPTTTIGRFQVTTNTESRVGRFSVSRAPEQSPDPKSSSPPFTPTTPITPSTPFSPATNGPSAPVQIVSPDSPHKASLPSLNNSFNNSYLSSDNDSEFEDEDFKREVNRLREKHMIEIQTLHSRQKEEIESLFARLGKVPPATVLSPVVPLSGRRRRPTKSKSSKSSRTNSTHGSKSPLQQGTNSTNAVGGSGVLSQSQGGSQCLAPNVAVPHQRKGTFTDDLHKLVDNWARDAMNLSQGKKSAKHLQQTLPQGHSYEVIQSSSLGRKYSAPSQLCPSSIGGSAQLPSNPSTATSLAARKGSLCHPPASSTPPLAQPQPPQFIHYNPTAAYSAQWSGPAHVLSTPHQGPQSGPLLVSTSQPLGPYPPSVGGQGPLPGQGSLQAFHLNNALQKSVSNPGGPNLRTT